MSDRLRTRLDWLVWLLGLAPVANGIVWLTLWLAGMAGRWSAQGQLILKTNMALGMILGGASLLLLAAPTVAARRRLAGTCLGALLLLIGGLTLSEHIFGWDWGIDQLLATEQPGAKATAAPNRMGVPGSCSLALLGSGLLALAAGRRWIVPYLGLAVCLINLMPLVGFLYGVDEFYSNLGGISWPTVPTLLALGLGLILSVREVGPMVLLLRNDPGGAILRRLLPITILVPLMLGLMKVLADRADYSDANGLTGLLVICAIVVFAAVVWHSAACLSRSTTARAATDKALRDSEQRERQRAAELESLLATVPMPIFIAHDPDCLHITGNPAADKLLRSAPGGEASLSAPPERRPRHFKAVQDGRELRTDEMPAQRAARGEHVLDFEFSLVFEDGDIHDVLGYGTPLWDEQGCPRGSILVLVDITERMWAEKELHASEARFRDIATVSADWIWEIDAAGRYTFASDSVKAVLGYEPAEILGRSPFDLMPPDEAARVRLEFDTVLGRHQPFRDLPNINVHKNGDRRHVLTSGTPIFDGGGVLCGYRGLDRDITKRKAAEDALRESQAQLRAAEAARAERQRLYSVLATLPVYVILLSEDYRVPFANRFFEERFGKSGGKRCHEYLFGRSQPCENCESYKALKTGSPHHWYWTGPDGRDYDIYDYPFTDSDGTRVVMEVGIDITEVRRAHAALQEANGTLEQRVAERTAELQRSNKELEQFAYISSHDLQEPLRQVMSFGNLLSQRYADQLDDRAKQYIGFMSEGSQRMSNLVRALLDYSRVGLPGHDVEPVPADEALNDALLNLQATIEECDAHITREPLPTVLAHPVELGQLFQNLVGNAVKFHRQGVRPEVQIGCRSDGKTCTFWVKDNGIGIPPDLHEKAFKVFQRLHAPGKYPGTGIGLAICKKIVERHGGRIWIESVLGEGATFFFTLPLAGEAQP